MTNIIAQIQNKLTLFFHQWILEKVIYRKQKEKFYLVFGGHIFFQTLHAAVRLNLFSHLEKKGPMTIEEISTNLKIEKQPARILMLGLTSIDFVKKCGDRYRNTYIGRELLVPESPHNVIPYILLQAQGMYKAMPHFYDALLQYDNVGLKEFEGKERTFYERLAHDPELGKIFQDAMQSLSVQTNKLLARFIDFSSARCVVDVGGGDGSNLIALAKQYPQLKGIVFDLPAVCKIAKENIARHGLSDRITVQPGNCFDDDFPQGANVVLFCHFFTIWSKLKNQALLNKAFKALPAGGRVVLFNMMQDNDETGPLSAAVGSPYFLTLATGEGMLYTWNEYMSWMRDAGFPSVNKVILPRDHGAIIGTKDH